MTNQTDRQTLSEAESKELLRPYGVTFAEESVVEDVEAAVSAAEASPSRDGISPEKRRAPRGPQPEPPRGIVAVKVIEEAAMRAVSAGSCGSSVGVSTSSAGLSPARWSRSARRFFALDEYASGHADGEL